MIKSIIFDIDGVLTPGNIWHKKAFIYSLNKIGIKITESYYEKYLGSLPTKEKVKILSKKFDLTEFDIREIKKQKNYKFNEIFNLKLKKNNRLINLFTKLKKNGLKLACCSNSIRPTVVNSLSTLGVIGHIEFFFCGEDFIPKPSPEMYIKAIEALGVIPQEVLILEDSIEGIKAAKKSGAYVLKINNLRDTNFKNINEAILKI